MIDLRKIEDAAEKLVGLLPADPGAFREDLRQAVQPVVEGLLNRMDLVTREEFEAQTLVLARTREKLEALEKQIAELESAER